MRARERALCQEGLSSLPLSLLAMNEASREYAEALWRARAAVVEEPDSSYAEAARAYGISVPAREAQVDHSVLFEGGVSAALSRRMLRAMECEQRRLARRRDEALALCRLRAAEEGRRRRREQEEAEIRELKGRARAHAACGARIGRAGGGGDEGEAQEEDDEEEEGVACARSRRSRVDGPAEAAAKSAAGVLEAQRAAQLGRDRRLLAAALGHAEKGEELDPVAFLDAGGLRYACTRMLEVRDAARRLHEGRMQARKVQQDSSAVVAEVEELASFKRRYKQLLALNRPEALEG